MNKIFCIRNIMRVVGSYGLLILLIMVLALPSYATDVPANFAAFADNGQVALSWNAVSGAQYMMGYRINGSSYWQNFGSAISTTSGVVTGLTNGTAYDFTVRALISGGYSDFAPTQTAIPLAPPTNLAAQDANARVNLSWTKGVGATSIQIWRSTTSGGPYTLVNTNSGTSG